MRPVLLLVALISTPTVAAESETKAVLENILKEALVTNPGIAADRTTATGAEVMAQAADRLPDPTLGVGYSPVAIETRGGPQRVRATVEQAFPFFGKRGLRKDVAQSEANLAGKRAEMTAADVILAVKEAFWEVYRIDRAIDIATKEGLLIDQIVSAADSRYATGAGNQANLLQAQLARTRVSNRLILLRGEREGSVQKLAGLVGVDVNVPYLPETDVPPVPADEESLVRRAIDTNPDVTSRETTIKRARSVVDLARKDYYPDFALSAGWGEIGPSSMASEFDGRDTWSVGAMVKIPLYRGDLRDRERAGEADLAAAESRLDDARLRAETAVTAQLTRLRAAHESIDLFRTGLIPQAQSAFESAMSAYSTGALGFADLIDAERSLLDVELGRHEAIARYQMLVARLERILGSKDENTLFPIGAGS